MVFLKMNIYISIYIALNIYVSFHPLSRIFKKVENPWQGKQSKNPEPSLL